MFELNITVRPTLKAKDCDTSQSKGVPVERVSILLGHSSPPTTIQHYSSWIQARQEQVEQDVRLTWA
jgi:hypothetical protein